MLKTSIYMPGFYCAEWFAQNVDWAMEAGLDNLDVNLAEPQTRALFGTDAIEANVAAACDAFARHGLKVFMGHAPYPSYYSDPAANEKARADIRYAVKLAGRLGIAHLVVHPICTQPDHPLYGKHDTLLKMNIDLYTELVELGRAHGVTICTENMFANNELGRAVPTFCSTPEELNRIMDAVPGLRVCIDNGHYWLLGIDMAQAVHAFGDRLAVVHLHSNDGISDSHTGPFEMNALPWQAFCKALKQIGFSGTMNLESCATFDQAPRAMYPASFRYLQQSSAYLAEMVERA